MSLIDEYKKALGNRQIDSNMLVPILVWLSGHRENIELCQSINQKFFIADKEILALELTSNNKLKKFIKYPKALKKEDKELQDFEKDICTFFNWTSREYKLNKEFIDIESLKYVIADKFGYDKQQRRKAKIKKK